MKILHVITTIAWGGAEKQLCLLVREQVNSGHKIVVCYLKGLPQLEKELTDAGAEVFFITNKGSILNQILKLRERISVASPQIVHAHLPRAEIFITLALIRIKRVKLVITRHNTEQFFPGIPRFISQLLSRLVIKRASKVITISNAVKEFIIGNSEIFARDREKLQVIYYGIRNKYKPINPIQLARERSSKSKFRICTIARLVPQKDYPTLLMALRELKIVHKLDVELNIVGSGELFNELFNLAESLEIGSEVKWLDRMEKPAEFLSFCDVFVLSTHYEGFGLVLLEAISVGLPVLASNINTVKEVLGENSLSLFQQNNYKDCARKLMEVFQNNDFRDKILNENRARLEAFTISNTERLTRIIYLECSSIQA